MRPNDRRLGSRIGVIAPKTHIENSVDSDDTDGWYATWNFSADGC